MKLKEGEIRNNKLKYFELIKTNEIRAILIEDPRCGYIYLITDFMGRILSLDFQWIYFYKSIDKVCIICFSYTYYLHIT